MKQIWIILAAAISFFALGIFTASAQSSNNVASTQAVYVPDMTHANDPMPDGIFAWDALTKTVNAAADQATAQFTFNFTNVSGGNVAIMDVHPSCGCTTAQLPSRPWLIPSGTNNPIPITVNIAGKIGTLYKYVDVSTDKGIKRLNLVINIMPAPPHPAMTDQERAQGVAAAKVDRQAVFKGDCATCHAKPAEGKMGVELYAAVCGICHDANPRATMVPDLRAIKTPTNDQFWQTWIAHGKPGSLMPAFATADGGPLTDTQIASIAAYLNVALPSHPGPSPQ